MRFGNCYLRGFAPARRDTFVSAKVSKIISALSWPCGFPAMLTNSEVCANSLRSNSAQAFSGVGCASRPHQKTGTLALEKTQSFPTFFIGNPGLLFFDESSFA